ncbi:MAG: hypothetical protein GW917_03830, partial [Bdellovibrionales bacterium]|nr:hypothetical protein [Bdellovibrionales bacterium]
ISNNSLGLWGGTKNGTIYNGDAGVGNVGIGTTTPGAKLHVEGTGVISALINGNTGGSAVSWASALIIKSNTNIRGRGIFLTTTDSAAQWYTGVPYLGAGYTISYDASGGQSEYIANSKFLIQSGGNVGIGTTAPLTKLHVSSLATFNSTGRFAANGIGFYFGEQSAAYRNPAQNIPAVVIRTDESNIGLDETKASLVLYNAHGGQYTGAGITFASRESIGAGNDVALSGIFGIKESVGNAGGWSQGGLRFWTKNMGNIIEAMAIVNNGSVGIGTVSPGAKLNVSGGNIVIDNPTYGTTGNGISVRGTYGGSWARGFSVLNSTNGILSEWGVLTQAASPDVLDYAYWGTNYGNPWVAIKSGNVGIGTTG